MESIAQNKRFGDDKENNLFMFSLPSPDRPGKDLVSKLILRDVRVMKLLIKSLVDAPYCENLYRLGESEWSDSLKSDVVYAPLDHYRTSLPPVLIEIQNGINESFLARLIKYAVNIYEIYGQFPVILIIGIGRPLPRSIAEDAKVDVDRPYLWPFKLGFWKTQCFIMTKESLSRHLNQTPLPPLAAVGHFLTSQKWCA
ncbi:uncharacterized protein BYT42DRAFT_572664 [Radiomyces spectabilis]|uniref:uncharacterized protein n=1 Tax=Radiomyces spectabilis TaxID=64574 RepID=UPI00221F2C5C|nr:uncharacterized protein BYT42DRAFT_572664 [Radiomyces spectabilis]KAI8378077.1 hypothetical protein BYT42DRAFT_572664 [Radiomyces spectabilis]